MHGRWKRLQIIGIGLGELAMAPAAQAEVLQVSGVYPAASDGAAALQSIAVERFGGADGAMLSIRIEDALRAVAIDGQRYFTIVPARLTQDAQAVLRGTATAEVTDTKTTQQHDKCTARDDNGKCTERQKVDVPCIRRKIEFAPGLRLAARNGYLLWRDDQPEVVETTLCEDDSAQPKSVETTVRELADKVATRTRIALAPTFRRDTIRVLEERRGLSRDDGERFKQALRLTKSDAAQACGVWQEIAAANPGHAATVFNTGLCAESQGDLDLAQRRYQDASALSRAGNIGDAMRRLAARRRALAQLEAHRRSSNDR